MPTLESLMQEQTLPVILVDDSGYVVHINGAFSKAFGWEATHLLGAPLTRIIPVSMRDAHHLGFARYLRTEEPAILDQDVKLSLLTSDGDQLTVTHHIIAGERDGKPVFAATLTPPKAPKLP